MHIKRLGRVEYLTTWAAMQAFTEARTDATEDELWVCEHPPVFTQGIAGKPEHLLANPRNLPVIQTDRGGQITYHGPGQAIVYCLLDLRRLGLGVRALVRLMEGAAIDLLAAHGIHAKARIDAPGVYVAGAKIAALGLKVRKGCTYHGLSLNVRLEDGGFADLNPCGYAGLAVTELAALGVETSVEATGEALAIALAQRLGKKTT